MTLSAGDVAALAREVVDARDPDLDIRIVPADPVDPYRREPAGWTVVAGQATSYIGAELSLDEAAARLHADLDRV
jgi:hypothetical protein